MHKKGIPNIAIQLGIYLAESQRNLDELGGFPAKPPLVWLRTGFAGSNGTTRQGQSAIAAIGHDLSLSR